jgi:nitrite reductase (NADH) small subunit/3-phenylpropionate/trans-cinnamate dioxygenase ferredoxin subunit
MSRRHHIGPLAALSESEGARVTVDTVALAVYRRGERVLVVDDACPHMGASLSEGYLDGESVVCPWHGWCFDVSSGRSPFDDEALVAVHRVSIEDGEVYVELAEAPAMRTGTDPPGPESQRT